jgi:hypothetical protein
MPARLVEHGTWIASVLAIVGAAGARRLLSNWDMMRSFQKKEEESQVD